MMWNREDIIWAAGLFEGEGCITTSSSHTERKLWRLILVMKDKDVIDKLHSVMKFGNVTPRVKVDQWCWEVGRQPHVYALIVAMYPWLGDRRKARAREAMKYLTPFGRVWGIRKPVDRDKRNAYMREYYLRRRHGPDDGVAT